MKRALIGGLKSCFTTLSASVFAVKSLKKKEARCDDNIYDC